MVLHHYTHGVTFMSYISLEANIGVGKSTLLPLVAEELRLLPVEENLGSDGAFLVALGNYNENPSLALELQLTINDYRREVARFTLFDQHIVERSMLSDMVFTKVMHDRGDISLGDYKLFMATANNRLSVFKPRIAVQLMCDPDVAFNRMKGRARAEESNNDLEYITQLENAHLDMLPDLCWNFSIPLIQIEYTNYGDPKEIAHSINAVRNTINANK